jgi:hypothetical protein
MMRRNTRNFRSGERPRTPVVADHHDDDALNASGCAGVENALKSRPFMRGQNPDLQHRHLFIEANVPLQSRRLMMFPVVHS